MRRSLTIYKSKIKRLYDMNDYKKPKNIRLGTRRSPLALAQAEQVRSLLLSFWSNIKVEIVHIVTSGDKFLAQSLADIGGKGLFTKEIEEGLSDSSLDIAVHSMKDMPTILPQGLVIGAVLKREDPRDVLLGKNLSGIDSLPEGAVFGTSSLRRAAQIKIKRPDIQIKSFRGNVQSRLSKLESGEVAATMLAKAGLNRLGIYDIQGCVLDIEEFLPAIAQGAIGIECRSDDEEVMELIAPLNDTKTQTEINCERAFLRQLDGSCRTPISGYAVIENKEIFLRGLIAKPDGSSYRSGNMRGHIDDYENIGINLGKKLSQ